MNHFWPVWQNWGSTRKVIQPCALLTAKGGSEMGTSKLNTSYLQLNCYTSIFCIGNSLFNNGFIMVILVVQTNYWDTELRLQEGWDLGFLFPYRENLIVGCPLRTVLLTYKPIHPFNITLLLRRLLPLENPSSVLCPFAKKGVTAWISFANSYQFCSAVTPQSVPASPGSSKGRLPSTDKGRTWTSCCASWSNHGGCQDLQVP